MTNATLTRDDALAAHFPGVAFTRSLTTAEVADLSDLEQEVWSRVLRRDGEALRGLRGRDDSVVRAFLCTVALNVARDARRRALARPDATCADPAVLDGLVDDPDHDPEDLAVERERRREVLEAARAEVRDDRDFLIFQLYYRAGATAPEIAALPGLGLTTKGVETVLHRLTGRVRWKLAPLAEGNSPARASTRQGGDS